MAKSLPITQLIGMVDGKLTTTPAHSVYKLGRSDDHFPAAVTLQTWVTHDPAYALTMAKVLSDVDTNPDHYFVVVDPYGKWLATLQGGRAVGMVFR